MSTETIAPDGEIIDRPMVPHKSLPEALAAAQAEFGPLARDCVANVKSKKSGVEFSYRYSSLGNMFNVLRPVLNRHGLSISHRTKYSEGGKLILVGRLEWSGPEKDDFRETELFIDAPSTDPQAIGSYMTYARRYTFEALVGVAAIDDDDGQAAVNAGGGKNSGAKGKGQSKQPPRSQQGKQQSPAEPPPQTPEEWENEKFNLAKQKLATLIKAVEVDEYVTKLADNKHMKERPRLLERILKFALQVTEAKVQKKEWDEKTGDDLQRRLGELLPADADQATQAHFAF